jgi:replicative DNA helicase
MRCSWGRVPALRNSTECSELAGKENLAVLVVSQLSRDCEKENRRPRMADFRDSGSIEQDGNLILALHSPGARDALEILVLKNHQGPADTVVEVARARGRIGQMSESLG